MHHISAIEELFFHNGISKTGGEIVIHAALRDCFTFLATMCGLLRGETLFKAELSDVFLIIVKKDEDPHPLFVMMMQFSTGKVNQGFKLYGRMARNFDVNVCPIGALGFYLLYRFHNSNEMDGVDFCDNISWFNTKLLTTYNSTDNTKCIKDKTYAAAVK